MAAARAGHTLLSELTCSVCKDYFKDPVCLDCGHNFCRACITQCWQGLRTNFRCPECRETFSQRNFKPNRQLRNIVEASRPLTMEPKKEPEVERECEKHKEGFKIFCQEDQIPICVDCRVSRDHTVVPIEEAAESHKKKIQPSMKSLKLEREEILSFKLSGENKSQELLEQLETDKQKIVSEFEQLSKFLKEQEQLQLGRMEEVKKGIEKRRDEYVAKLSEELSSVSSLISEVEQKCQQPASEFLQDITGTLRRCKRKKFHIPAFSSDLEWESSQKTESLDNLKKKLKDTLSSRVPFHKADVTLDPDTAHSDLVLSEDGRRVRWEPRCLGPKLIQLPPPDTPERFDSELCVLGREGFTSGRHYWEVEVEVEEKGLWAVGVARESVSRKGQVRFNPEQGIWAVLGKEDGCWVFTAPGQGTNLPQVRAPRRVQVYLDCEAGQVAFYDAGSGESIVTFPPAPFAGERIRPILYCEGYGVSRLRSPTQLSLCVSRDHRGHSVVPIDEAAEDYKDQIQISLKIFKEERDKIQSFKLSGEKKSQELLEQLETDKQKIVSEFEQLSKFLKKQKRLLLAPLEELKKEIEQRWDEYIAKLSSELSSVRSLISEMEQKCQQPVIEFLQDITGTLRRCEREKFQNPVVFSSELKWKVWESSQRNGSLDVVMKIVVKTFRDMLASREQLNKADMTLDPDTAHPLLVLSEDQRRVTWERRRQRVPDTPERFDTELCVLGREGFTSGRHYWEVEVEGGRIWAVGVAREPVSRKGGVDFSPEQGVWAVQGRGDQCWACISPGKRIDLPQGQAPHRVRVYLDCEGGRVAFYDAGSGESIFTFPPAPFAGERICPILRCVGNKISLCTHPPRSPCAPEVPPPPS
ncbi:E3 ubiquitin-protein ligase TRIM39-like [Pelodiscus sinensis]|uniref:E3 ubiquitin-protein ligase TRIM39-like n=1 Tax=Pelodiscus sinensis TaxID=13735 RepID=UPI003F6AA6F0